MKKLVLTFAALMLLMTAAPIQGQTTWSESASWSNELQIGWSKSVSDWNGHDMSNLQGEINFHGYDSAWDLSTGSFLSVTSWYSPNCTGQEPTPIQVFITGSANGAGSNWGTVMIGCTNNERN